VTGLFTRVFGVLEEARAWYHEDLARAGEVCTTPADCYMGSVIPHIRIPDRPPVYDPFALLLGQRISISAVSIALVDDRGRWPRDRGLDGILPVGWSGPELG
jgi:hypothetical protein